MIGTYYVLEEYRERGIGLWLFDQMFKESGEDHYLCAGKIKN